MWGWSDGGGVKRGRPTALSAPPDDNVGQPGVCLPKRRRLSLLTETLTFVERRTSTITCCALSFSTFFLLSSSQTSNKNNTSNSFPLPTAAMASYPPLAEREIKNTICLFDVDGTLTPARLVCSSFLNYPPTTTNFRPPRAPPPRSSTSSPASAKKSPSASWAAPTSSSSKNSSARPPPT